MNQKEIKELIEFLVEKDIAEFELERGDVKLHIKRSVAASPQGGLLAAAASAPVNGAVPASPAVSPNPAAMAGAGSVNSAAPSADNAAPDLHILKSPIVGTFYEAPSPGAPPFVKVGDTVQEGQALCIIEAMKLMNEIEAEVSGVIAQIYVANGDPVEYGMPLFGIRKQ